MSATSVSPAAIAGTSRQAERARLAAFVHDEVLATLNLAARADGPLPGPLVRQARSALVAVRGSEPVPADAALAPGAFAAAFRARLVGRDVDARVQVHVGAAPVPREAAQAVLAALDEAVRNSLRHAGGPAPGRSVRRTATLDIDGAGVRAAVADDGVGFDAATLDPRRLGVRHSIVERMACVPGGSARVDSAPGSGTQVTLTWRRGGPAPVDTGGVAGAGAAELRAIGVLAVPLLRRIAAGGALTAAERTEARVLEARLRDRIRAPALTREPLVSACDTARRHGADVLLLDDGDGARHLPDDVVVRLAALVAPVGGGRVTVRVLPPGRAALVTVLVDEGPLTLVGPPTARCGPAPPVPTGSPAGTRRHRGPPT